MPISDGIARAVRLGAVLLVGAATMSVAAQESGEEHTTPPPGQELVSEDDSAPEADDPAYESEPSPSPSGYGPFEQSYGSGVSADMLVAALESAAEAGMPLALWRLGVMYETGVGVEIDRERAFGYFETLADRFENVPPQGVDADIVADSFIRLALYYRAGIPDAGIAPDLHAAERSLVHAATRFRSAEAQYQLALLYLEAPELGYPTIQAVRWFRLSAQKGHAGAQARLGDLLFRGDGFDPEPVEGLMWLTLATRAASGTPDEDWINALATHALSMSTIEIRDQAVRIADMLQPQLGG